MKKGLIIGLTIAAVLLLSFLAPRVINNPGVLVLTVAGYQIEMSLLFAAGAVLTLFIGLWLVIALLRAPGLTWRKLRHNNSRSRFNAGLLALSEGKWRRAEKLLVKSASDSPNPELSYMAAARAAVAQNKLTEAEAHLDRAEEMIDNPLTVDLTRCELWLRNGQAERAIPLLQQVLRSYPNNPRAVRLLTQASQQGQHWATLKSILPKARKLALLSPQQSAEMAQQSNRNMLSGASDKAQLQRVWDGLNKSEQSELIAEYCRRGIELGDYTAVTEAIEKQQKKNYSSELVWFWSQLPHNLNHRIKVAEKWRQQHPQDGAVLDTLGHLYMDKQRPQDAETVWLEALKHQPSSALYQQLGALYQNRGESDRALHFFQQANQPPGAVRLLPNTESGD